MLVGHPVDLYSLLPLGEIGLAAARMHEPELAAPVWNRAMAVLDRLGNPPLWAPAFHWYGIQAAILTNRPHAMTPHATALLGAARSSQLAAALARAGRHWVTVLGGEVDAPTVDVGRPGARRSRPAVGGRAAGRATPPRGRPTAGTPAALMECARDLLGSTTERQPATGGTVGRRGPRRGRRPQPA